MSSLLEKIRRLLAPPHRYLLLTVREFTELETSSGILLLLTAVMGLLWANSLWAETYFELWQTELAVRLGQLELSESLLHWINDGLMALFFFVIGLEIKREVLVGELSSLRQAILPVIAAVGGMLVPAVIYAALNAGTAGSAGWGIPVATDIAFALGVLALLGRRVPEGLKIFLVALAIVDDIGAVLVIALFYTAEISGLGLVIGTGFLLLLLLANISDIRQPLLYALLGIGLWLAFLEAGIHTTVAGVLVAMLIPARPQLNIDEFVDQSRSQLERFKEVDIPDQSTLASQEQQRLMGDLEKAIARVETPLQRLERSLHPWAIFIIIPLFALANAGVSLSNDFFVALTNPITLGIIIGLVIGKSTGISLFTWLTVRSGLADLPEAVTWRHIYSAGWLAGIGFTMSLFIANLAFTEPRLTAAKIGVLTASLIAGMGGWLLFKITDVPEN
jgi:NhaA family Na+:H+ antiporter